MRFTPSPTDFLLRALRRIKRLLNGEPLKTPPLVAATLDKEDADLARKWLKTPEIWTVGNFEKSFESEFTNWNNSNFAAAFMGGRVALSAIIDALDLEPGDEVIVPGYTCIVVPNAFEFENISVSYADIELDTYGPSVDAVKSAIGPETKALLVHHLFGLVCRDFPKLLDLADREDLFVIEDCTHAAGACFRGRKVGNFGDAAFFSSEHSKCFSTVQGGLAVTNDPKLAEKIDAFRKTLPYPDTRRTERLLHTQLLDYYTNSHESRWILGDLHQAWYGDEATQSTTPKELNSVKPDHYYQRMPDPLAAMGLVQLEKLDHYNKQRQKTAKRWRSLCDDYGFRPPVVRSDSTPVFLRYPVLVPPEMKRDLTWAARKFGVSPGRWFKSNLHPVERVVEGCPRSDHAVARCINFPTVIK